MPAKAKSSKPTIYVERRILNLKSAFQEKQLCDGPTFTAGDACKYECQFCYVPSLRIATKDIPEGKSHSDVIIRRKDAVKKLTQQLLTTKGEPKFDDPNDTRVVYASPLVDVAADIDMLEETAEMCKAILKLTWWHIRLLSKSNLLPRIAAILDDDKTISTWARQRVIYGVSTGTADNQIAKSFEKGTPLVSKRIESLHWLQANGFRTFGMICPSLPRPEQDYEAFSKEICDELRINHPTMEQIWAEVINVRGDSLTATAKGLREGNHPAIAKALEAVSGNQTAWEEYNRATFLGHTKVIPAKKLRYLTYVTPKTKAWWEPQVAKGAVLLGKASHNEEKPTIPVQA